MTLGQSTKSLWEVASVVEGAGGSLEHTRSFREAASKSLAGPAKSALGCMLLLEGQVALQSLARLRGGGDTCWGHMPGGVPDDLGWYKSSSEMGRGLEGGAGHARRYAGPGRGLGLGHIQARPHGPNSGHTMSQFSLHGEKQMGKGGVYFGASVLCPGKAPECSQLVLDPSQACRPRCSSNSS